MRHQTASPALDLQVQHLARLALGHHLERAATDLAVSRESLSLNARIHRQVEALAAVRALDGFAALHMPAIFILCEANSIRGLIVPEDEKLPRRRSWTGGALHSGRPSGGLKGVPERQSRNALDAPGSQQDLRSAGARGQETGRKQLHHSDKFAFRSINRELGVNLLGADSENDDAAVF